MTEEDKKFCAQFMLETTFATNLAKEVSSSVLKEKLINNPLYTKSFNHFVAASEDLGQFEIRILDYHSFAVGDLNFVRRGQSVSNHKTYLYDSTVTLRSELQAAVMVLQSDQQAVHVAMSSELPIPFDA